MSLEIKVYPDLHDYEPKPMFGLKWRQLGALAIGVPLVLTIFFGVTVIYVLANGFEYAGIMQLVDPDVATEQLIQSGTTLAMIFAMVTFIPFAIYGWLRPKGLKPEQYIPYWFTYLTTPKELCYGRDDTGDAAAEPVGHRPRRGGGPGNGPGRSARGKRAGGHRRTQAKRRRRALDERATSAQSTGS